MRWQIKCFIDNCKGMVPFQNKFRKLKRRLVPYRPSLSRGAYAIDEGIVQVQWLRDALGTLVGKTILEIGSGTGYLSAALGLLGRSTHSIDIQPEFTALAKANLRAVPQAKVQFELRDAFSSAALGEYDVVAVTGSLPVYDTRFERSLRVGGRLFVIVGAAPVMDAILVRRIDDNEWIRESLFETVVEPLINAVAAPKFVF